MTIPASKVVGNSGHTTDHNLITATLTDHETRIANHAVTVEEYGAVGNGVTDDSAAFIAAVAASTDVYCGAASYNIGATLGTIPANTTLRGGGKNATTLLHGFNGNFATMANGTAIENLTIEGQGATYTGKGLSFTGTDGKQSLLKVRVINFDSACLDFAVAAGSGFQATQLEAYRTSALTTTGRYAVTISATQQLSAVPRSFSQFESGGQCAIDFGGCNDTYVTGSTVADLLYTTDTRGVHISGSRILNDVALTVDGHNNTIVGCDVLPAITIASGADNVIVGPNSYNNIGITDSSGNCRNQLTHYATTYTPTLTAAGTAPALGNGTLSGVYSRQGSTTTVEITFTVGSTTTLGTGGLRFSLPQVRYSGTIAYGTGQFSIGATSYTAAAQIPGNVSYVTLLRDTSGAVTFNSPGAFGAGDIIRVAATYTN